MLKGRVDQALGKMILEARKPMLKTDDRFRDGLTGLNMAFCVISFMILTLKLPDNCIGWRSAWFCESGLPWMYPAFKSMPISAFALRRT